jgi:hypothetical protein
MEGGSLFNSGFLGASFNWWIGQIASDSTWRDNILPGKFENKDQIPGWGRRYKVRIIGLHDQGETEIPSDQLPWAQVMYPVTAGGGQAGASQTPNLRQGNFVFGFFLDEKEQQVPVIMGVLGNNAQTSLATKIGDGRVTNTQPGSLATSGFAEPADGNKDPNIRVPDDALVINKPKDPEQSKECSPPPPGVAVNKFGLRSDQALTKAQFQDQQSAKTEAEARGLTGLARDEFIQQAVAQGIKNRCEAANSPSSPSRPGATRENADAIHEQSNADTKRLDLYLRKTVLLNPNDLVGSALKAIQTELENLTREIDKILHAAVSYVDAASQILSDIGALIADFACTIAKYMKIVFDKIFEYVMKQINKSLSKTVDSMFPNQRYQYFDVKERITELIRCLYTKITGNLCGQIQGFLNDALDTQNPSPCNGAPYVPICSVETLTGSVIATNMGDMNDTVGDILNTINTFLTDIQDGLALVGAIGSGGIGGLVSNISGSITSALSFENISLDIFGCDLKPNSAASDYYTLQNGSGAAEEAQQPRPGEVNKAAQNPSPIRSAEQVPFATPLRGTTPFDPRADASSPEQVQQRTGNIA